MKTTAEYLDIVKAKLDISSDYKVAAALELERQAISRYRNNKRAFDNYACMKISAVTGIPLETIIADMELVRETDEKRRNEWAKYMKSLGGLAAGIAMGFFVLVTSIVTPTPQQPLSLAAQGSGTICIMSNRRKTNMIIGSFVKVCKSGDTNTPPKIGYFLTAIWPPVSQTSPLREF